MINLTLGANAPVAVDRFRLAVEWPAQAGVLDCTAFLLGADGKVRGDADMVFYNQPAHETGALVIIDQHDGLTAFQVDLGRVPGDVERVVLCAIVEGAGATIQAFAGLVATLSAGGDQIARFRPELDRATEAALRVIELYRRNGAWKVRADGQGFNDGLAPLARSFGVDVAEDEEAPPREAAPPPPPPSSPGVPAAAPVFDTAPTRSPGRAAATAAASRVVLDEANPVQRWPGAELSGVATARLAWSSRCGGADGRPGALSLALGCLYKLADGRRGAVQAWDGDGQLEAAPFVRLGAPGADTQELQVNVARWAELSRLALYAFIPDGPPSWRAATVGFELTLAGRTPVAVPTGTGVEGNGMLGLMTMERDGGDLLLRRLVRYLPGHQELDDELGWNLRWKMRGM